MFLNDHLMMALSQICTLGSATPLPVLSILSQVRFFSLEDVENINFDYGTPYAMLCTQIIFMYTTPKSIVQHLWHWKLIWVADKN